MNKHLQWLVDNSRFLKISAIERELKMPEGHLAKFISGTRNLPANWESVVVAWVENFRTIKQTLKSY